MTHHLTIITGASRGLGLAMAEQLLAPTQTLLCLSRHVNDALAVASAAKGCTLLQWSLDLAHAGDAADLLSAWLRTQAAGQFTRATLINNAAVLPRIAPLREAGSFDMARALRVGLEAPMQLTAAFLRDTLVWHGPQGAPTERRVLNISSGNGRRPMASQAIYSAVKAGMDHFTRCLALEEALVPNGAKVCSLAPGVIDTDMQSHLRESDAQAFPDHARFVDMKAQGQLSTPQAGAARVLAWAARSDFGDNPVADVRDEH